MFFSCTSGTFVGLDILKVAKTSDHELSGDE